MQCFQCLRSAIFQVIKKNEDIVPYAVSTNSTVLLDSSTGDCILLRCSVEFALSPHAEGVVGAIFA